MFSLQFGQTPNHDTLGKNWWIFILLMLLATSILWSFQTSGVLEMTTDWSGYPWGYKYILKNYDNWPINKENSFYVSHHQAFQGVEGSYVALNSGFELHRTLYAALTTCLWFLGPLLSMWIFNITFWGLTIYSIVYAIARLGGTKTDQIIAAMLTLFGQGFVYSVGEFSPHVVGYGAMYCIYGFTAYHRIWDPDTKWQQYGQVYALIGLLQIAYNSAWLSLPVIGVISLYRILKTSKRPKEFIILCGIGLMAIVPYVVMLIITKTVVGTSGIISYNPYPLFPLAPFLKYYILVYIEGLLGMNPLLVAFSTIGLIFGIIKMNKAILILTTLALLQIAMCTIFMLSANGRGYVTFTCSASFVLLSVYGLSQIYANKMQYIRTIMPLTLIAFAIFTHLPKIANNRLPLMGFYTGYILNIKNNKWHQYDVHIIS